MTTSSPSNHSTRAGKVVPRARYPLHITLAAVFVAVLLAFGAAIIGFNYRENRRIALLGAQPRSLRGGGLPPTSPTGKPPRRPEHRP